MDLEKVRAGLQEIQSEQEEQSQASESPSAWDRFIEHPLETIGEVVTNRAQMQAKYAQDSAEVASEMAQGAVDTAHDIAAAYNDFGEKRKEFLQQGAELQQEYSPEALAQANETGDYSAQSEAVQNAQTAGDEMVTATRNLILSPGRQAVRSFVNAYEDDTSNSLFAETAHSIASSDAGIEYLMTDAERMQKAKAIQDKTGIPVEAFLGDTKAYRQAMDIYDFAVKNDALPNDLWQQYPELQNLANMSPHDAAIALHHIDEVSTTHGIVDTFTHFLEIGNKNLEYNNLQYKIFMGTADDNDRQRAADLRAQLEQETKKAPSFFSDPGAAMAAGIAQSLPEMWQSTVQAIDDAAVMASVAMIAGAAAGSAVGGVGALPGAAAGALGGGLYGFGRSLIARQVMRPMAMATRAGLEASVRAGAFRGMLRPEVGQRYAEYKELKDKNGNPLLTDDEAKWYALAGGAANAGIELANFGAIKNTFARAPHASKVFSDIIRNSNARLEANEAFRLMARDKAADMFKITLSESGEEALQSVSDDVVHNRIVAGRNTDEKPYDASTIAGHAFQSFTESLPGSMGFGLASGIGGGITTSGRLGVQMRDRAKFVAKYGNDARKTINGTLMLEELQQAISSGKMREKAPETQQKILKEQLDQTEYKDTYIDTEVALQSPNGMEDLKKAAKAGGYTDEELQVAITEKGHLLIPTERLAQAGTSSELLDAASFTQDSESMGRMRMNAKATMEAVQKQEQEDIEKQVKLFDTIVDEYYPTDESGEKNKQQRDMLKAVIFTNARNPAQGWNKLYKETRENLDAMLEPALKALNEGMGHAGLGEITDEVGNKKTVYTSDNAPWYRNFYKAYKRRPTKAELEDMAVAMVTGDSSAPQVQGFIPTTKEEHEAAQAMKPEIENLRHTLAGLREIKKAATSLTGAEMQITEGLSKEAYHVYRDLTQKIIDVDGNIKGKNARAARMGALLVARHADRWAEVMSKNTGKKVTALDWYRSFEVSNSEKPKHENADGTPYATMNQEDSKKKIIAHSQTFKGNSGKEALKSALNWFKETYPHGIPVKTAIGKVNISRSGIKDSLGHGFSQKKLDVIPTLPQGLSNAVLVREIPDDNPNKRLLYQYMVYKVFIDDKENYVLCRIKDDGNVKKLYVHEVATAEEINKMSNSLHAGTGNQKTDYEYTRGIALYNSILSDYLKSVKENNNSFSQQTTAFAAWFGTSKILNEDGSPRVMYHGTATDGIRVFDTKKAQDKAGRQMGFGWGKGKFYFTGYENIAVIAGQGAQSRRQGKNPQAMPVYLRVEKPISAEEYAARYEEISGGRKLSPAHYDDSYTMKDRDKFITKLDKQLKKEGYDGIVDGPLTAPSAVAVFSNKQIKSVNNTGAWDINNPDIYYQRAWHGSPYEFNAFDLGAIGSGEGNQVHGWGLYFAKNREISEAYKETFGTKGSYVELNNRHYRINDEGDYEDNNGDVAEYGSALESALSALEEKKTPKDAIAYLRNEADKYQQSTNESRRQLSKQLLEAVKIIKQDKNAKGVKGGRLYSVEVPEENEMLDEQKQLDEQPIEIQEKIFSIIYGDNFVKALKKARQKAGEQGYKTVLDALTYTSKPEGNLSEKQQEKTEQLYEKAVGIIGEDSFAQAGSIAYDVMTGFRDKYKASTPFEIYHGLELSTVRHMTGHNIYERMTIGGQKQGSGSPKEVSLTLKKYGIKGITYDGQRDGRCFVVFDDKAVQIIEQYNQAINQQERLGITSTYTDGFRIVSLLENANESTFMHEMAHIFLLDLQQLAAIDSVSAKSLQIVNEWAAWHKGAAEEYRKTPWAKEFADREQAIIDAEAAGDYDRADKLKNQWRQERFARAFELYLRDGQAPAKGLKAVFRAFAKFLRQVYRAFLSDGGTASEQVRRVMDRMIATEDEIEAAALDDRYNDVTAAGGEKLFNESEKETYQRWWQESLEEAKEKLRKVVFKDLEEVRQREFDQRVAIERARKEKELQGEPVYIAMRALEETNYSDLNIVLNWFGSLEEFQKAVNETPSLEDELNKWMQEYRENLDKELLQAEITDEVVDQAMMGASYRAKLEALTGKAFAKKQSLVRSINAKTRQAMRSVEEKLDAIPDDIDLQMDKESNVVKELWKTIYKLRSSKKWSTDDYRHLNSLLKSATKEEARKAYKEFKQKIHQKEEENREKARQQKQDQKREQR